MSKPKNFQDLADQMVRKYPDCKVVSVGDDHLEMSLPPDMKPRTSWKHKFVFDGLVCFIMLVVIQWGSQGEQEAYNLSTWDVLLGSLLFTGIYLFGFLRGRSS